MKNIKKYIRVWWLMSRNSFISVLYQKLSFLILLTGKLLRFFFFILFLSFLAKETKVIAGYTLEQTLFFFLTFNFVDIVSQFFFREVYRFRPLVVSGGLDLILVKPVNALLRVLMGGADIIDFVTIPPLVVALFIVGKSLSPSMGGVISFFALIVCGLLISTAFHIFVLSFGILTFEIDHVIMIYRDFLSMGRFPIDIYREPIRSILTYLVPVGIMITFPAKALMGLLKPSGLLVALVMGLVLLWSSLKFWNYALKRYSSASS